MDQVQPALGQPVRAFAEADYRYGVGELRMTVEHVNWAQPQQHDGEIWYEISGLQGSDTGTVIGPRQVTVRASRLSPPQSRH